MLATVSAPLVVAGVAGAGFVARAAAARRRGEVLEADVPLPAPSLALAGAVALDSLINMPMSLLSSVGSADHYARASQELDDAVKFYAEAGWLDDPALRHPAPAECPDGEVRPSTDRGAVLGD